MSEQDIDGVKTWLAQMPPACKAWWEDLGCEGDGGIIIGGDSIQAYTIECPGCENCKPPVSHGSG